jgi:HPt (histidine-containing phosphotransfer) domain-containing protein
MTDAEAPVPAERLQQIRSDLGDPAVFREFLVIFLAELPKRLDALRRAVSADDATTVKRVAHTLRGSSAYLGAKEVVRLCQDLEARAAAREVAGAAPLLDALEAETDRVQALLRREIEEGGA